jgi:hypothetical protein
MVLFFIYDEYTDKLDGEGARACADLVVDALKNPHKERPQGESKLGEITRQYVYILCASLPHPVTDCIDRFWLRAMSVASEAAQRRFLKSFAAYVYAVIDEASDRNGGHIRGIRDYLELRRLTAATSASFFSAELGLDIPDEIMTHPAMESLLTLAAESIVLTNVRIQRPWQCVQV